MTHTGTNALEVQALWAKYEDIAMHFNDLLMRLRTRSLAGVAAISTLVGIFTHGAESGVALDWLMATALFVAMAFFWVALCCLDVLYYNRLLVGAVRALTQLEAETVSGAAPTGGINMSTLIEAEFSNKLEGSPSFTGVIWFYGIVFGVIVAGAVFSARMYCVSL